MLLKGWWDSVWLCEGKNIVMCYADKVAGNGHGDRVEEEITFQRGDEKVVQATWKFTFFFISLHEHLHSFNLCCLLSFFFCCCCRCCSSHRVPVSTSCSQIFTLTEPFSSHFHKHTQRTTMESNEMSEVDFLLVIASPFGKVSFFFLLRSKESSVSCQKLRGNFWEYFFFALIGLTVERL